MNNRAVGNIGEELAVKYLIEHNFTIIDRNKNFGRMGEIDIIASDSDALAFIEVKRLQTKSFGHPIDRISKTKQRRICQMAELYLAEYSTDKDIRFDAICIHGDGKIEHFKNAFSYE